MEILHPFQQHHVIWIPPKGSFSHGWISHESWGDTHILWVAFGDQISCSFTVSLIWEFIIKQLNSQWFHVISCFPTISIWCPSAFGTGNPTTRDQNLRVPKPGMPTETAWKQPGNSPESCLESQVQWDPTMKETEWIQSLHNLTTALTLQWSSLQFLLELPVKSLFLEFQSRNKTPSNGKHRSE